MKNTLARINNVSGICFFIEALFNDLGIPVNEQIILWEMSKNTIGCQKLKYYLLCLTKKFENEKDRCLCSFTLQGV